MDTNSESQRLTSRPRSLLLAAVGILLVSGCKAIREDSTRFEVSHTLLAIVLPASIGLAMLVGGLLLIGGLLKPKNGKPRALGVIMTLAALGIIMVSTTLAPFIRVVITKDEFRKETGFFGNERTVVQLKDVERIELYRARYPRDSPRHSISRKNYTFVEFAFSDRESTHVSLRALKSAATSEYLIALAAELDIPVVDQRDEVPRFRVHNPFASEGETE